VARAVAGLRQNFQYFQLSAYSTMSVTDGRASGISIAALFLASLDADVPYRFLTKEKSMKRIQQGFTLIELMIVVAIVGILAAIALPAYQDYVVRSKMSEAEAAIAACKTSVSEYTSTHAGSLPVAVTDAGCSTSSTHYVLSINVTNGVIVGTTQNTGSSPGACILSLAPGAISDATISVWNGTFSGCDSKFVPSSFRG
jgi:type IV pilus assembly protein PilA